MNRGTFRQYYTTLDLIQRINIFENEKKKTIGKNKIKRKKRKKRSK